MIEQAIWSMLSEDESLTTLINKRIFPLKVPEESTIPCIVYQRQSTTHIETMDGVNDLKSIDLLLTSWSQSYDEASEINNKIGDILHGFRGYVDAKEIKGIFSISENHIYVAHTDGSDEGYYGFNTVFKIWYV